MRAAGNAARDDPAPLVLVAADLHGRRPSAATRSPTASRATSAAVDGFAAGALLVMLIDSMIPEAARRGGDVAGLVTVLGFAVAAALSSVS